MTPLIEFDRVSKSFGALTVVRELDLAVQRGEFLSLLGPSGSGKTTILMMLAGFEAPTRGSIRLEGNRIDHLPPHRRNMGVVFQSYALFPHMTVAENVAFPLRMRGVSRAEAAERVGRALDMVRLAELTERRPSQLSGGQQQRIALARALVFEPNVVLMDEPLGALDKQLREHMQLELRDLHRSLGLTIVFVTHDQSEALTMSDRIAVFNEGRIEQIDIPQAVYDRPRTRFVAEFIGETNVLEGRLAQTDGTIAQVEIGGGRRLVVAAGSEHRRGDAVLVCIRPERLRLGRSESGANALPVAVSDRVYQGDHIRVHLAADDLFLVARLDRRSDEWPVGTQVVASFDPDECTLVEP